MAGIVTVDRINSEVGKQRRTSPNGRVLHCCCICGRLDVWGNTWAHYSSLEDEDIGAPIPKMCSLECREKAGAGAENVTPEMKQIARDAEWREPKIVHREMTDIEKYRHAVTSRKERGK